MAKKTTPPTQGDEWDSFDQLVTWAAWEIMQGLLRGERLADQVHFILGVTRAAKFKEVRHG